MLVVDIQKFVTSMLANTDTPVMAHRPEVGQKDRLRGTQCKKSPGASGKHPTPLERCVRHCSEAFSTKGHLQCGTLFFQFSLHLQSNIRNMSHDTFPSQTSSNLSPDVYRHTNEFNKQIIVQNTQ